MRRVLVALAAAFALTAGSAEAVTIRELIELSKAGLGDDVLIALIEVDRRVFTVDPDTVRELKKAGISDAVIVALIRTARTPPEPAPVAAPAPAPEPEPRKPEVIVIEHRDQAPAPQPVAYPVGVVVPGYPTYGYGYGAGYGYGVNPIVRRDTVKTTLQTDHGLVTARVPVPVGCVKAAPVYWGFGGKLRPGSWQPDPIVVCR